MPKFGIWIDNKALSRESNKTARLDAFRQAGFEVAVINKPLDVRTPPGNLAWPGQRVDLTTAWGSISFVDHLHRCTNSDGNPNVFEFFTPELHFYHRYEHQLPRAMKFNADAVMLPFGNLCQRDFNTISTMLNAPKGLVIKPDNGLKSCEVYTCPTASAWHEALRMHQYHDRTRPTDLFWVAPLRSIESEYRCLVFNGQVVDIAHYAGEDVAEITREAGVAFANNAAKHIQLDEPLWVLDIVLSDGEWSVMELNCASTSGWYGLDVSKCAPVWAQAMQAIYDDRYA